MARYNGRLHCIVGVLPTCYKRKAAIYFYPPGGTGPCKTDLDPCDCLGRVKLVLQQHFIGPIKLFEVILEGQTPHLIVG